MVWKLNFGKISKYFLVNYEKILFNFATFVRNNTGGQLIIDVDQKFDSVIQFSDRPFRQLKYISLYDFILLFFIPLFLINFKFNNEYASNNIKTLKNK